jgi:uncharacterized protein YbaA (DUF1428 family)
MAYVDGFVIPVKKSKLKAYRKMALLGLKLWKKHGAVDYKECVLDDPKEGHGVIFPKLAKVKAGETVIFSFIVYKSKAHRAQVNKKVMSDPAMANFDPTKPMPFDFKRMSMGGFRVMVSK